MSFFARTKTNANGVQTTFPVSFPLAPVGGRNWVGVYVHPTTDAHPGTAKVSGVDFNWVSDGQIAFTGGHVPANGTVVEVRRLTNITVLDNTIQAGGSLRSAELAQNDTQLLNLTQELADADADLQSQIDVESAARIAADTAEATTRAAADTAEANTRATADAAEIAARVAAITAEANSRVTGIAAEAGVRAAADTILTSRVAAVEGRTGTVIVMGSPYDMSAYPIPVLTPEQFGAQHHVLVDDGASLHAMCVALNILGGGVLYMNPAQTYWVGGQAHNGTIPEGGTYTWAPTTSYPLEISGCTRGVKIMGNGACIRTLAGQKFGVFDDAGNAVVTTLPYFGTGVATPYQAMLYVHGCSAMVQVENLELDGNIINQVIGGKWGDSDWQLPMTGMRLADNTGGVDLNNVVTHHHGLDGYQINGPATSDLSPWENGRANGVLSYCNGRQGLSLVGGRGWSFTNCTFSWTGKGTPNNDALATVASGPGGGVDFEAEGGRVVRDISFTDCQAIGNYGPGFVSDGTDVDRVTATRTLFIGTTNWTIWGRSPRFLFESCRIMGAMVDLYGNADPNLATKFRRCHFLFAPSLTPTGVQWGAAAGVAKFHDPGSSGANILMDECILEWNAPADGVGSYTNAGEWRNCTFKASVAGYVQAFGTFTGPNTNFTNCTSIPRQDMATSMSLNYAGQSYDSFLFNGTRYEADTDRSSGKKLYYKTVAYDPPSLANGAADAIQTTTVTGAALGDLVQATFDQGLAGMDLRAWVSAADTVRFYFINENGANPLNLAAGNVKLRVRAQ